MNLSTFEWDQDALKAAHITKEKLSRLVPTTKVLSGCNEELAQKMGILENTPFVVGASDGVLSNLGVGVIHEGDMAITIGTSGAIRTVAPEPRTDTKERIFCYALTENHWVIGGPVNNGGMVLRWTRDELAESEVKTSNRLGINPYDALTDIANRVDPGANGLLFHPYLAGERAPFWNDNVRGSFIGLTLNHKKEHMIRAALEGVIFNLYMVFSAIQDVMGVPVTSIQATGGFSRSKVWRQMLADIFGHAVTVPESYESSCLGACLLGLYGQGKIDSFDTAKDLMGATYQHVPEPEHQALYNELIPIFSSIASNLEHEYEKLAVFQKRNDHERHSS
ncbi:hypothetical protein E4U82_13655 [Lentibacillus salicampi]|uniref:Gluconate kinase n=1 Tax=Lentibacillus salicampi TaxID=175306 RepID=A0A4Y9A9R6_9BACI|nr:FGGY-family carbohydrate kinase [Lentibacillus salicampi]TFJ92215.1 hypothetical protein E4U82_13655 [Lentibacillus salicampi]